MIVTMQDGSRVDLTNNHFVATGGQASVYVRKGIAFKVYTNPADMVPDGKLQVLRGIRGSSVVKPLDVFSNQRGERAGFTMQAIPSSVTLGQLCNKAFRERHKLTTERNIKPIAASLRSAVQSVHDAGAVVVDLNELNCLVDSAFASTFVIDVDSFQTAGYPATVLMPSVRDYQVMTKGGFSELSDWFSYAVIAFQLFIGIHPYRGKHKPTDGLPPDQRLERRMRGNLSAFRSDVTLPGCCYPLGAIPDNFRAWLRAVLDDGKRCAPPDPMDTHDTFTLASVAQTQVAATSGAVSTTEVHSFDGWAVLDYIDSGFHYVARVERAGKIRIIFDNRVTFEGSPSTNEVAIGLDAGWPLGVSIDTKSGRITVHDYLSKHSATIDSTATQMCCSGRRFLLQVGGNIVELSRLPNGSYSTSKQVGQCMENATQMFDGVAIQSMLGSVYASVFHVDGGCVQHRLKELDGSRVVAAQYWRKFMVCISAKSGRYFRHVFDLSTQKSSVVEVQTVDINAVELDSGLLAIIGDDERLLCYGGSLEKNLVVDDDAISSTMRLCAVGGRLGFMMGDKVYQLRKV